MLFRDLIAAALVLLFAGTAISMAAPVTGERTVVGSVDAMTAQQVAAEKAKGSSVIETGQAFALINAKQGTNRADGKSKTEAMSSISLPPAILLFGGAIGAIFWLGRRRKQENANWE